MIPRRRLGVIITGLEQELVRLSACVASKEVICHCPQTWWGQLLTPGQELRFIIYLLIYYFLALIADLN